MSLRTGWAPRCALLLITVLMSASSAAMAKPGPPVNSRPPTVTGAATLGQTLLESHGSWAGKVTSYAIQWLRCDSGGLNCANIAGATFADYIITAGDVGHTLRVQEVASNTLGAGAPAVSLATPLVTLGGPVNQLPPSISGNTTQGQTLTEVHGTWAGSPTGFSYQWESCNAAGNNCSPIVGATSQTYALALSDIGHTVRVAEVAINPNGASSPATSSTTAMVVAQGPPFFAPSNTLLPVVSGSTEPGQVLTTSDGAWSGNPPPGYSYVWQRCASAATCSNIPGATGVTYTLTYADLGALIRSVVTATNNQGTDHAASSEVGPVTGAAGPGGAPPPPPTAAQIKAQLLSQITPRGKASHIGQLRKHGSYTYSRFKVSTAGKLTIRWYYLRKGAPPAKAVVVATVTVIYRAAGAITFKIKLTRAGKAQLASHPKRLGMTAKAWFSPTGSSAIVAHKSFTVTR
jgi:hypothetical protein